MHLISLLVLLVSTATAIAQTKTVTLTRSNTASNCTWYACNSNDVITVNSFIHYNTYSIPASPNGMTAGIWFVDGQVLDVTSSAYGLIQAQSTLITALAFNGNAMFTGVTNISLCPSSRFNCALTFTITTPTPQSMVPVNAVVIPTDAKGPVQIVLESSGDLVNWVSALPGTYGNTYSNRFFRVRAVAQ